MPHTSNVRALGWFVRFLPENSAAPDFYSKVLSLPVIRRAPNSYEVFWAGETLIFELLMVAGRKAGLPQTGAEAGCTPVFRVHQLDNLLAALKKEGAPILNIEPVWNGRQAMVRDPEGRLVCLREQLGFSPLAEDNTANRRRVRGEAFNPGCTRMPPLVQELGWVLRRVVDVAAMTRYYVDVVGLRQVAQQDGHVYLELGDNSLLELAPGGQLHDVPADRSRGEDTFLIRVSDAEALRARIRASGTRFVNEKLEYYWTDICYCTDPEGQMFGFQQIRHPRHFSPKPAWPENLEAERRWVEVQFDARNA